MLDALSRPLQRAPAPIKVALRLWRLHQLIRESLKFLTVGGVGLVVDLLFNALLYAGGDDHSTTSR